MPESSSPIPQKILRYLEENPGARLYAIVNAAGCARSTVRYYLDQFRQDGLIEIRNLDGRRQYTIKQDRYPEQELLIRTFRRNEIKNRILNALAEQPGCTRKELACRVGNHEGTLVRHLNTMLEADVIMRERDGHAWRYYLSDGQHRKP